MPSFLIGTQRSGSNLLRLMIDQSPDIIAPHPPHILERLGPLVAAYGDLTSETAFRALIQDVRQLVDTNPVSWGLDKLDICAVVDRCRTRSLTAVYGAVHDILATRNGARDWFCKSLGNVHYVQDIETYFADTARYIHLHRDPRDVALSFQKAIVGEKTWYHIARKWNDEQCKALKLRDALCGQRFLSVAYADLVVEPEETLVEICDFIGIPFQAEMLEYHTSRQAQDTAEAGAMWGNVVNPVMSDNAEKFLALAPVRGLAEMEYVASEGMEALGYKKACAPWVVGRLDPDRIAEIERCNIELKEAAVAQAKPEDLEQRSAQAAVMVDIRSRLQAQSKNAA